MPSMRLKKICLIILFSAIVLSGCAGVSIPPEQLKYYALIEGYRGNGLVTGSIITGSLNVESGTYTFETVESCRYDDCPHHSYKFYAEAGNRYKLRADNTILVMDRSDPNERIVDKLALVGDEYVTRKVKQEYVREQINQTALAEVAVIERRKQNLTLIRKVGAQICKTQGLVLYIGYVEFVAEEKIQIRVVDAVLAEHHNARLGDFSPSIIWDNPLNWDICE